MSMAADPQTVETPARLPKPGDVDWFLTAADRARAAKALRESVEAPTMWGRADDGEWRLLAMWLLADALFVWVLWWLAGDER